MPSLKVDQINLNEPSTANQLLDFFGAAASDRANYFGLRVERQYHLASPDGPLPSCPGWYLILEGNGHPLYVGSAKNLDSRLNSDNGSRDDFGNPQRKSDDARNLIKKLHLTAVIGPMSALVIIETALCGALKLCGPLSDLDRGNVEKFLGIFRSKIIAKTGEA